MRYLWIILFPLVVWGQNPQGRLALLTNSIPIGLGLGIDFTRGVTGYASGPYIKIGLSVQSLTNQLIQTNGANLGSPSTINYTRGLTGYVSGAVGNIGVSLADTNLLVQTNGVNVGSAGTINFIGATGAVISGVNTIGGFGGSSGGGTNFNGILVTNSIFLGVDAISGALFGWDTANEVYWQIAQIQEDTLLFGNASIANNFYGSQNNFLASGFPNGDNTLDWGHSSFRWRDGYFAKIHAETNASSFTMTTNDFVLNAYMTNSAQRSWVAANVALTNVLAGDRGQVALYLDQNGDGTWERTGIEARLQGVALSSTTEELSAFLQPNARFLFTNLSAGTATATIVNNSSQWVRQ